MTPDLVLLGNLLVDDIVYADGSTRMAQPGGAMLYASLAAVLWGASTGCVSVQGDDYPVAMLAELRARGVLLDGIRPLGANGIRTWLLYEGGVGNSIRRVIHRLGCPSHEAVSPLPAHVPEAWRTARAFHLAPMPLASQAALVHAIRAWEKPEDPAFVSLDPHVPVTPATLRAHRELLAHVDAFFPSDDELRLRGLLADVRGTLASLASGRLRFVAWKRGAAGGSLYDAHEDRLHPWTARAPKLEDPTGAGDAFAAGFVCAWLERHDVELALRRAVVTAGIAIGAWGPDGLLQATRDEALARLATWDDTEVHP